MTQSGGWESRSVRMYVHTHVDSCMNVHVAHAYTQHRRAHIGLQSATQPPYVHIQCTYTGLSVLLSFGAHTMKPLHFLLYALLLRVVITWLYLHNEQCD